MAATLKLILIALGFASVFLLVGLLLRSKIKVLQKLFLPASVIGGIVGLILVQVFSRVGAVAEQVTNYVSVMDALPAILIVPIFASTPLANFKRKDNIGAAAGKATAGIANGVFWLMCGIFTVQMVIGFGVNFFMTKAGSAIPFYKVWGFELAAGFTGGHGTAASIGAIYSGIPAVAEFASQGKDVATTFATFGLIGGMILGIIFINIAARRGTTAVMKKPAALEGVALTGLQNDVSKQESLGRETTKSFTIETLSVHLAVILGVVLASYGVSALLARVPAIGSLLKQLPVWSIAMVLMLLANKLISALKLEWMFDKKVVQKLSGFMTDFAIVCAIASMNLKTIATFIVPIVICSVIGFVVTYFYVFKLTKFITGTEAPFEHSIIAWGTSTGVLMTGLVLLKVCDPNYETSTLNNFTKGFAIMSIVQAAILGVVMPILIGKTDTLGILLVSLVMAVAFTAGAVIVGIVRRKRLAKVTV